MKKNIISVHNGLKVNILNIEDLKVGMKVFTLNILSYNRDILEAAGFAHNNGPITTVLDVKRIRVLIESLGSNIWVTPGQEKDIRFLITLDEAKRCGYIS